MFLGFVNFYRRFIQDFSKIARPLHASQRKDAKWTWGDEEQRAFDRLKESIISAPVLVHPVLDQPFKLETDSSNYATGAVLSQMGEDGKWHPVGFHSKSLNDVQRNYDIHDKELLAIMDSLSNWRQYMKGCTASFQDLDGSQKPPVLQEAPEAESMTGTLTDRVPRV